MVDGSELQVAHTVKVAMPPYQAEIYNWVCKTGTLREDPEAPTQSSVRRSYATLNNKCMELRKVCPACCLLQCSFEGICQTGAVMVVMLVQTWNALPGLSRAHCSCCTRRLSSPRLWKLHL